MTDQSEAFTHRELLAQEDEITAEIERDLTDVNEEIQGVKEDLVWWRAQSSKNLSQIHESARENIRLSFRLMQLTRQRMDLEHRQNAPSQIAAWQVGAR